MILLKPEDIMRRAGVSRATAISIMRKMPHMSVGNGQFRASLRVAEEDFDRWIRTQMMPALPSAKEIKQRKAAKVLPLKRKEA